jgi:PAS domain S-box-containing protein
VVFDAKTDRFVMVNENAVRLFGLGRETLLKLGPGALSPPVQPDGRLSYEAARELIQRALDGETPTFEWMHLHSSGRIIPCEIRLVRLPAEERFLVRGSITDNTERQRRDKIQQAVYQISEAVHTVDDLNSLYARIHEIIKGLMPAENFYIALFDQRTETFRFAYFVDERDPVPAPMKLTLCFAHGQGVSGLRLQCGPRRTWQSRGAG